MLSYRKGTLFIDDTSIESLARKFGTPLFAYSRRQLTDNFKAFDGAFAAVPRIVCFATKANSNGAILKTLAQHGAGADITSGGELYRSLRAGFKPNKIVYAGIGKTAEEIDYALDNDILIFNVESREEIEQINRCAGRKKKKAAIAFRVNPNVDPHTHRYITTGKNGSKFGIPYAEAMEAYRAAAKLPNIDVAGVHCHIGSQITTVEPFRLAAERIENLSRRLAAAGIPLRYVNLGGGLGIRYDRETPPSPQDLSKAVLPAFKDFKGTFIFEPGRYIVGNAGILVARVIYRKKSGGKSFLITDGAMNDLIRPTLYEAYHAIAPVSGPARKTETVDVVGPICETGDFLGLKRRLPWMEQGEFLAVQCAGAYGMAMSSQYNSRVRAAEVMIVGKSAKLIRRRETYADLVAYETK